MSNFWYDDKFDPADYDSFDQLCAEEEAEADCLMEEELRIEMTGKGSREPRNTMMKGPPSKG